MIDAVTGTITKAIAEAPRGAYVVLVAQGLGLSLRVLTTTDTAAQLARYQHSGHAPQSPVTLFTCLQMREGVNTPMLFGFQTPEARDLFELLLEAAGVGPKVALALLEIMPLADLVTAIVAGESKPLTKAKGVGPKLAQKLVIELHEKMTRWRADTPGFASRPLTQHQPLPANSALADAESALGSLGYEADEIDAALHALAQAEGAEGFTAMSADTMLHRALSWLSKHEMATR